MPENGHVSLESVIKTVNENHRESMEELRSQSRRLGVMEGDVKSLKKTCEDRPAVCLLTHRADRYEEEEARNTRRQTDGAPVAVTTDPQTGRKVWVMWGLFLFAAIGIGNVLFDMVAKIVSKLLHIS